MSEAAYINPGCRYLRGPFTSYCGVPATESVKIACAHEHLYETTVCDEHKDAEIGGCWECVESQQPHAQCPAKIVSREPLNIIDPPDFAQSIREAILHPETNTRIFDLLSEAIPAYEGNFTVSDTSARLAIETAIESMRQS